MFCITKSLAASLNLYLNTLYPFWLKYSFAISNLFWSLLIKQTILLLSLQRILIYPKNSFLLFNVNSGFHPAKLFTNKSKLQNNIFCIKPHLLFKNKYFLRNTSHPKIVFSVYNVTSLVPKFASNAVVIRLFCDTFLTLL